LTLATVRAIGGRARRPTLRTGFLTKGLAICRALFYPIYYTRGTIATNQLLPEEILVQEFKPESYWRRIINMPTKSWLVLGGLTLLGSIWAHALRKKTPILLVIGGGWIVFGLYWISRRSEKFVGCGFIIVGLIWLVWGAINLRKAHLVPNNISENLME
jgi:hypothetical protein